MGEAWRISKFPYDDLVFRSYMQSRGSGGYFPVLSLGDPSRQAQMREKAIRRIIQSSKWNKLAVSFVVAFASAVPIIEYSFQHNSGTLLAGTSLSLLMLLGYSILYEIQILPGLVSAESLSVLETLPISDSDTSLISVFSFIRTIDYILVAAIMTPTLLIGLLTGSIVATVLEFVATSVNMTFAAAASVYLARLFYRNLSYGGRSIARTVLRISFVLMWGLLIMGLGFFFNYLSYVTPLIDSALQSGDGLVLFVLSAIHPFSFAYALMNLLYPGPSLYSTISVISISLYLVLAALAGRWSLIATSKVASDQFANTKRDVVREFRLRILRPIFAYALKDFRVAYRNPSTAFLVAAPVFETVIIILPLISANILGTLPTLIGTFVGGLFASFTTVGLLNAEGAGFEYTRTLPVSLCTTIRAKALTATASFIPVPVVFIVLSLFKPLAHNLLYALPLFSILSVAGASMAEITIFLAMAGNGRMVAFNASSGMLQFSLAMVVGGMMIGTPLGVYGLFQIVTGSVPASLSASALASAIEFLVMIWRTSKKK